MKIVDLNVLLYAVNRDSDQHDVIHGWWQKMLGGDETVGLPWVVQLGFLRLATNPHVFPHPLTVQQAGDKLDGWLALPIVAVPEEKANHWPVMRALLSSAGTAGNLTTDAHIAALALTRGATVVSCDNDFARFDGLRYENPLVA